MGQFFDTAPINNNLENYSTLIGDINTKIENNRNISDRELKALLISQYIVILTSIAVIGLLVCLI